MNQIIIGVIRHALTAFGGGLVAGGDLSDGELQLAVGAVLTLIGTAWSIYEKRRARSTT